MVGAQSEIILYQSEDGQTHIQVLLLDETVWLTQAQMAELFDKDKRTISEHIQNIFEEDELEEGATVRKFRTVQTEGEREVIRDITHYNLDVIISVGYRVKSHRGTQFRRWATQRLKEYIIKGFVMDDERLKQARHDYFDELIERVRAIRVSERRFYQKITDIYATSVDYDASTSFTQEFFATVQNKFHYAIHGMTAAEVIKKRVDSSKPYMGLTSFKGERIRSADVTVAKNYLSEDEISSLDRIVDQYLSFAEEQAKRRVPMKMQDWITKLHGFLTLNDRDILQDAGKITMKQAQKIALEEYEKFKLKQDAEAISDFDKSTHKLLAKHTNKKKK